MNRETIIQHFTEKIKEYEGYAKNIAGEDSDDLFQQCALQVLLFPEERLIGYWNPTEGLKPFFLSMLRLQYRSRTSYHHTLYRKQNEFLRTNAASIEYNNYETKIAEADVTEIEPTEVMKARKVRHLIDSEMFPNEVEDKVFDLYIETGSLRKTLAGLPSVLPQKEADKFDLKRVHTIVRKFRKSIKTYFKIVP